MKTNDAVPDRIYQLVAAHPALDFINTLDWRFRESGPEELLQNYGDLVRFVEQSNLLTSSQSHQLLHTPANRKAVKVFEDSKELREALAETIYSMVNGRTLAATPLKILERHFQSARLHQALQGKNSHLEWSFAGAEDALELPLWLLAMSATDLITSEAMSEVRICDNHECQWLFLDTSKNHTKRWCDMKVCGNRMKARRFKTQRAS
jgi:predicted RNA-binding Zn ribbon-like protein